MFRHGQKIVFLLTYILCTFSSFGNISPKELKNFAPSEVDFSIDNFQETESVTISANRASLPFSSKPYSEQFQLELEPDEEDLDEKHFVESTCLSKEFLIYFSKAPPIIKAQGSVTVLYNSSIYILFQVFLI
jgi:hypothetical protein